MQHTDQLRSVLPDDLKMFWNALYSFDVVAKSCFSKHLDLDFMSSVETFKHYFHALKFKSKSTKLHILFCHVKEVCTKTGVGLSIDNEHG